MGGTTAAAADRGDGNIVGRQPLFIETLFLLLSLRLGVLARVILKMWVTIWAFMASKSQDSQEQPFSF